MGRSTVAPTLAPEVSVQLGELVPKSFFGRWWLNAALVMLKWPRGLKYDRWDVTFYCETFGFPRRFLGPIKVGPNHVVRFSYASKNFRAHCCNRCCTSSSATHALKTLAADRLARVKQTARRRRRYVIPSSSSSSAASKVYVGGGHIRDEPSVEVFAKNYCLHWQKKVIGGKIAQFGTCTFTPRTGKTSGEAVELVSCAKNEWGEMEGFLVLCDVGGHEGSSRVASVYPVLALLHCLPSV